MDLYNDASCAQHSSSHFTSPRPSVVSLLCVIMSAVVPRDITTPSFVVLNICTCTCTHFCFLWGISFVSFFFFFTHRPFVCVCVLTLCLLYLHHSCWRWLISYPSHHLWAPVVRRFAPWWDVCRGFGRQIGLWVRRLPAAHCFGAVVCDGLKLLSLAESPSCWGNETWNYLQDKRTPHAPRQSLFRLSCAQLRCPAL